MATTSSALAGTRPPYADRPRPQRHTGRRLLSVVGQLNAFVWGEDQPTPPSPPRLTGAEIARITGPVAAGSHPAPTPPLDKRSAVAHYRALAEQVARERRCTGAAGLEARGAARDA